MEEVKRLSIKSDVLRELYLKSGNQCAFPECTHPLVDENGNFVGQICHIEAAMEGGERFNPKMSNEERRSYDNLILMCYDHHIETNDVEKYSVEKLKQIKAEHEAKFSDVVSKMKNSIKDYGKTSYYRKAVTCRKLAEVLNYGLTEEQNFENAQILNKILEKLMDVPVATRKIFSIMVARSFCDSRYKHSLGNECVVSLYEVEEAIGRDDAYMMRHLDTLIRRNLVSKVYEDDDTRSPYYELLGDSCGWAYWDDIREFCKKQNISLERVCVDMDFSVFDE